MRIAWNKLTTVPDGSVIYGFRADVNKVFTKTYVSLRVKKFVVVHHKTHQGYAQVHNVLKNGSLGQPFGSVYDYFLYTDEQEALDAFVIKKQELKQKIIDKQGQLQNLISLI